MLRQRALWANLSSSSSSPLHIFSIHIAGKLSFVHFFLFIGRLFSYSTTKMIISGFSRFSSDVWRWVRHESPCNGWSWSGSMSTVWIDACQLKISVHFMLWFLWFYVDKEKRHILRNENRWIADYDYNIESSSKKILKNSPHNQKHPIGRRECFNLSKCERA